MTGSEAAPRDAMAAYETLIRRVVSPAMRNLGFKGSGGSYVLPDDDAWVLVGFQRSVHNSRDEVRFTVNLTVVGRRAWETARIERGYLPQRPAPNTTYLRTFWHVRLGQVMARGQDRWWDVSATTDLEALGGEVVGAIRDDALPAIEEARARVRIDEA